MTRNKNIHENNSGYKVPKGYFDTLEESLVNKLKSSSYSEKSGFTVPTNYFSEFDLKTPSEETSPKVIRLKDWSKWIAAASIVAFAVIGAWYIDSISPGKNLQFSDLDNDMIERYLDYHLETPEDYIDYENTSVKKIVEENINTLNDQDIIEYLDDKLEDQVFENE
jgi:hypothetical protein